MNIGLIASAVGIAMKNALSFNHFHLEFLRPQLTSPSSLCFFAGQKNGHCASNLDLKREVINVSTGKLRAVMGDSGGGAVLQDAGATALVVAGAYGFVSTFDYLTQRNLIQQVVIFSPRIKLGFVLLFMVFA